MVKHRFLMASNRILEIHQLDTMYFETMTGMFLQNEMFTELVMNQKENDNDFQVSILYGTNMQLNIHSCNY